MPAFFREYDPVGAFRIELCNHIACIGQGCAIELLSLSVQLLELARNRIRFVLVTRHEQLDATQCTSDPARRIQSGTKNESDSAGSDRFPLQARSANHRSQ